MSDYARDFIIIHPALRREIIARVVAANLGVNPAEAAADLGRLHLPDGKMVGLFARHAADALMLDECGQVALITRIFAPGAGKLALPGGFIDDIDGKVEAPLAAAVREAIEETGIAPEVLAGVAHFAVGTRLYDRPFDIREAWNDLAGTNIRKGDVFSVSTQAFCFKIPGNLHDYHLQAGDDAKAVN
ncbi:MAG: NUDIX domain-containing protein [Acidocella sp.]|nr:NUDIX domain-containing protein [Acidocella sp.]